MSRWELTSIKYVQVNTSWLVNMFGYSPLFLGCKLFVCTRGTWSRVCVDDFDLYLYKGRPTNGETGRDNCKITFKKS